MRDGLKLASGPLAALVLLVLPTPEGLDEAAWRTVAVAAWMALWWVTEAIPIAATALLPMALFPLLEILPIRATTAPYANPLVFLFLGGFILAAALERWNLHRRIALVVIRAMGTEPKRIVAGFMLAAALLSMWVSNTATAMMMLPIGLSVIELTKQDDGTAVQSPFAIALLLGLAYGCSIGGMATLIGTPTNAFLVGFLDETYGYEIAFADWMMLGLPLTLIGLLVAFALLTTVLFPVKVAAIPGGRAFIHDELRKLGPMRAPERRVALVFGTVALLWILRPQLSPFVPGLSDTGIGMIGAVLLFIVPSGSADRKTALLTWRHAERIPWGVLLLFGGGLSLAAAISGTGLALWIGEQLTLFANWPPLALMLLVVLVIVFLTELTSNVATVAAFVPILASIAVGIGENPLVLLVPATLAASAAFMLPVATPPNAIVYGSGALTIPQMARAGLVLNVAFILLTTLIAYLLMPIMLDVTFGSLPAWAE
ncbi:MAG: DASS family sodium-coupled anion symporter [Rhodothermales bacterium]